MNKYQLDLVAMPQGWFGVDVRAAGATGSTPFVQFPSWESVHRFFADAGLGDELLQQLEDIRSGMAEGMAYHETMFLPDTLPVRLQEVKTPVSEAGLP